MTPLQPLQNEDGIVLVTALIMTVILTVLMTGTYLTTSNELAISGNYKTSKQALYQADAGLEYTLAKIKYDLNGDKTVSPIVAPLAVEDVDPEAYTVPSGYSFSISAPGLPWSGNGPHVIISTGYGPNNSSFKIQAQFTKTPVLNPAFKAGLLSDGNITIHGSPSIVGDIHANGSVTQTGAGTIVGSVSAVGTTSIGSSVSGSQTPGAVAIDVPPVTTDDFDEWRTEAQISPNIYNAANYNFSDSGNLGGKIIFVDGDINVSGNIINGTIVATGNITVTGSSSMDGNSIGTAMIAGGQIRFNGSSDCYGAFWCNGSYVHNGAGRVHGSIVSGGNITRNGAFNFTYNDNINNDNLPHTIKVDRAGWKDQRG